MPVNKYPDDIKPEVKSPKVIVTAHARKRFRERVGLPKNACQVQAQIVYDYGFTYPDAEGKAKLYLEKKFLENKKNMHFRVYGEFIYIFKNTKLITMVELSKSNLEGFKHCKVEEKVSAL